MYGSLTNFGKLCTVICIVTIICNIVYTVFNLHFFNNVIISIKLPLLVATTGVTISQNALLTTIDMSSIGTSGIILISQNALSILNFPKITSIAGSMTITLNSNLTSIAFPLLTTINGALTISGNPLLITIYAPLLTSITGQVIICNNTALTTISQVILNTGTCHTICLQCSICNGVCI